MTIPANQVVIMGEVMKKLDDVVEYTDDLYSKLQSEAPFELDDMRLMRGGLSSRQIAGLTRELEGLPESYLELVQDYDLETFYLRNLSLIPRTERGAFVERVVTANRPSRGTAFDAILDAGFYYVGDLEAEFLFVASSSCRDAEEGTLHAYANGDEDVSGAAPSAGGAILAAANWDEVQRSARSKADKRQELSRRLQDIGFNQTMERFWLARAGYLLVER